MSPVAEITAFLDASVLYSPSLRNLLMRLVTNGVFRVRWSQKVHDEWITALLRNRPDLSRQKLERTRALMDAHAREAVVSGYESLMHGLSLPDPDDHHVVAAAIKARADVIVTFNLRHFPFKMLDPLGLVSQHPDDFIHGLFERAPIAVVAAASEHRESLKSPAKTPEEYVAALERQGLPRTASTLCGFLDQI